jgi:hypothetical protein
MKNSFSARLALPSIQDSEILLYVLMIIDHDAFYLYPGMTGKRYLMNAYYHFCRKAVLPE